MHFKRLAGCMARQGIDFNIFDVNELSARNNAGNYFRIADRKAGLIKYLLNGRGHLLHYHGKDWFELMILQFIIIIRQGRTVVTLHSFRDNLDNMPYLKKAALRYCLKKVNHWIAVGLNEKNKLIACGVPANRISVIPAFIFPDTEDEDLSLIPSFVWEFMDKNDFNIVANASRIAFYNGQDLYRIDMCVKLIAALRSRSGNKKIGMVFCLSEISDRDYYDRMSKLVESYGIEDRFLFVNERISLCPILRKSDLFIRPTVTDGDAVSLREALYYNIPAVASNVCNRPEGTILFESNNLEDLEEKVLNVIDNYGNYASEIRKTKAKDFVEDVLNVYKSLQ